MIIIAIMIKASPQHPQWLPLKIPAPGTASKKVSTAPKTYLKQHPKACKTRGNIVWKTSHNVLSCDCLSILEQSKSSRIPGIVLLRKAIPKNMEKIFPLLKWKGIKPSF